MKKVDYQFKDKSAGFSLIELLTVLVIFSVISSFAIPAIDDMASRSRLRDAADNIVSLINSSRSEAVKSSQNVTFSSDFSSSEWCVGARSAAIPNLGQPYNTNPVECDCFESSCIVNGLQKTVSSETFNGIRFEDVDFSFTIDGKVGGLTDLTDEPMIELRTIDNEYSVNVVVSPMGQASLCSMSNVSPLTGVPLCQ